MSGQWKRNIFLAAGFYGAEVGGNIEFVPLQILTQWKRQRNLQIHWKRQTQRQRQIQIEETRQNTLS